MSLPSRLRGGAIDESIPAAMAWRSLRRMCRAQLARHVDLSVEGLEHVPATGPVVVAARHYHHLYDGCAIGTSLARHLHILVAADWTGGARARRLLDAGAKTARWPVVLRPDAPKYRPALRDDPAARAAYEAEAARYLRRAATETVALLRGGHALLVFPEGYPTIDPSFTPKTRDDEVLPFQSGFVRLVALAQADGATRVPVVPTGLAYDRLPGDRWRLALRYGAPLTLDGKDRTGFLRDVEARIRALSDLPPRGPDATGP